MKFDYLIVGSGLFGSIFAYEAKTRGKKCLVIDKIILEEIFILKIYKVFKYISMELIYFIPLIKKYGNILINLLNLIGIQIAL